MMVGESQG